MVALRNSYLGSLMINSYLWSGAERLSVFVGNFFVFWFLAYIAGPEGFAPIAIISALIIVGNSLADGGMYSALIRLVSWKRLCSCDVDQFTGGGCYVGVNYVGVSNNRIP